MDIRKIIKILFVLALVGFAMPAFAQTAKEQIKERKELSKMTKEEVKNASKYARKEAKKLQRIGWISSPGTPSIAKQLDMAVEQWELEDKYFFGHVAIIGEVYDTVKLQAVELAKQQIVSWIVSEMYMIIENKIADLSREDYQSIVETVWSSKYLILQSIGSVLPVVDMYREQTNKNIEVFVGVAYSRDMAMQEAKNVIRDELKKKNEELAMKFDRINWRVSETY